jgi:DNA-binding transcriptional LysR family regulator
MANGEIINVLSPAVERLRLQMCLRSRCPRLPWPDSGATLGIRGYVESGVLIELLPDFQHKPLVVSLVVAQRRNLSRRVRAFMKWIEDGLASYLE